MVIEVKSFLVQGHSYGITMTVLYYYNVKPNNKTMPSHIVLQRQPYGITMTVLKNLKCQVTWYYNVKTFVYRN